MHKVAIIVPSISGGGSEKSLFGLLQHTPRATRVIIYYLLGSPEEYADRGIMFDFRRLNGCSFRAPRVLTTLFFQLQKERPNSIIAWSRGPAMVIGLISPILPKSNLVFSCRDYHEIRMTPFDKIYLVLLRRFDIILANSTENLGYIKSRLGKVKTQFLHLRNIIEINKKTSLRPQHSKITTICLVGRLEVQKGFDIFADSLALIECKRPIVIKIYGKGTQEKRLKQQLELCKNEMVTIMWMGFVKNMPIEIGKADLIVMPSRHEGFPNVLLEAMSVGTPVLASNCRTGPKEIIGEMCERGLLFENGNSRDLAQKINFAITNPALMARKALSAAEWLNHNFSEKKIKDNYKTVIDEICKL